MPRREVSRKFVNYSNTYFQDLNFVSCPRKIQIMPTHFTSSTISKDQMSCSIIDGISESSILFQLQKSSIAILEKYKILVMLRASQIDFLENFEEDWCGVSKSKVKSAFCKCTLIMILESLTQLINRRI